MELNKTKIREFIKEKYPKYILENTMKLDSNGYDYDTNDFTHVVITTEDYKLTTLNKQYLEIPKDVIIKYLRNKNLNNILNDC